MLAASLMFWGPTLRADAIGTTELVSANAAGDHSASGTSLDPVMSPDGSTIAFTSVASDLGPTDTNFQTDVYLRDLDAGTTELVSANAAGDNAGNNVSLSPVFSPDGSMIAFQSVATNLGPTDTNGKADVYVRDLDAGTTELVNVNAAGNDSGNGFSFGPVFSPDGSAIAFQSAASNLGPTDNNGEADVYLRDLDAGTNELVNVNAAGNDSGNGASFDPVFSPDGSTIAFESNASDLGPTDTNGVFTRDVYLRDLDAGTTELVSANAAGDDSGNGSSLHPVFSPTDGKVAFESNASDLGPNDTNGLSDVYLRDLDAGTTELVNVNAAGDDAGNSFSRDPVFSPDGSTIAFVSFASDLGPTDTNGGGDVYLRDLDAGTTELVNVNAAGDDSGNNFSGDPVFSPDGGKLAFESRASDLGPTDTNGEEDVYLRDVDAGTTEMVSVNAADDDAGNGSSSHPVFSPDGLKIAFLSNASDLGPTDTNDTTDVYVRFLRLRCGEVVTKNTVLTENLGPCPGHGLLVGAPGITLNLDGHTIRGSGVGNGVTLAPGVDADDVVVTGGRIVGFANGVALTRGTRATLSDLEVLHNDARGAVMLTDAAVVTGLDARANGSDGLLTRTTGRTVVRDSVARNNARSGLHLNRSRVAVVRDVVSTGNGIHGILARADRRVIAKDNRSHRNDRLGIRSTAPVATIDGNAMVANASLGLLSRDWPRVGGNNAARNNNDSRRQCRPDRLCP